MRPLSDAALICSGLLDEWYGDSRKGRREIGIGRSRGSGFDGGRCSPPPTRSQTMPGPLHGRLRQQVDTLRREFLQEGELPFADVLSPGGLAEALAEIRRPWNDRIFTPLVTLWAFLGQVLNANRSCRAAVARLIAHRAAAGRPPCSSDTGGYCQARKRLPERFFAAVARLVGRNLDARVDRRWLWKGRRVCLFDGSTVSMPDTPTNRAA